MPSLGWLDCDLFLEHQAGGQPERPERILAIRDHLRRVKLVDQLTDISFEPATPFVVSGAHDAGVFDRVRNLSAMGGGFIDDDTYVNPSSLEVALHAVGAARRAVDAVWDREVDHAWALCRPPGHHAERARSMGFCLFNNIALGALRAIERGAARVAIVDFDVHHGNGTEDIFRDDPRVLFISTHQHPLYPGTGAIHDTGTGDAEGTTINLPVPEGAADDDLVRVFDRVVAPAIDRFEPDLVLVSAGFDAHVNDPLAGLEMSPNGFNAITDSLMRVSGERGLVLCLEGGYDLTGLTRSLESVVRRLITPNMPIEDGLTTSSSTVREMVNRMVDLAERLHGLR